MPSRWKVSAAWARRAHDCTLAGIAARCHARCCHGPTFWPARAYHRDDLACGNLGPRGCVLDTDDRPVTCLLYPLMVNKSGTLVLHHRATTGTGPCKGNHGQGPPLIETQRGQLTALFGAEQYERVRRDVLAGRDSWFDVPDNVYAAFLRERDWEAADIPPTPRSTLELPTVPAEPAEGFGL